MRQKRIGDYLLFIGCGLLVYATTQISWIAGLYCAGGILILLGVIIDIGNRGGAK